MSGWRILCWITGHDWKTHVEWGVSYLQTCKFCDAQRSMP
jgi:hypothetical protein